MGLPTFFLQSSCTCILLAHLTFPVSNPFASKLKVSKQMLQAALSVCVTLLVCLELCFAELWIFDFRRKEDNLLGQHPKDCTLCAELHLHSHILPSPFLQQTTPQAIQKVSLDSWGTLKNRQDWGARTAKLWEPLLPPLHEQRCFLPVQAVP